jgi:hypothetical protein
MKRIVITIAAIAILMNVAKAQDKAFEKGDITAGLGIGVGLYGTKLHTTFTFDGNIYSDDKLKGNGLNLGIGLIGKF